MLTSSFFDIHYPIVSYMGKKLIHFVSFVYFTNNKLFSYFAYSITPFSSQYTMNFFVYPSIIHLTIC